MKGPIGGRPPPRECPICGERISPLDGTKNHEDMKNLYEEHLHATHQGYEKWDRRLSAYPYVIPFLFLASMLASVMIIGNSDPPAFLVMLTVIFILAVLASKATTLLVRGYGRKRFRESWIQEHGQPTLS